MESWKPWNGQEASALAREGGPPSFLIEAATPLPHLTIVPSFPPPLLPPASPPSRRPTDFLEGGGGEKTNGCRERGKGKKGGKEVFPLFPPTL